MEMVFRSPDPEGSLWHQRALGRLRRAMRRLQAPPGQVRVQLDDLRGKAVDLDKRCRVEVALPGEPPVAITAVSRSWKDSIEAAAGALRLRLRGRRSGERQAVTGRTATRTARIQTAG